MERRNFNMVRLSKKDWSTWTNTRWPSVNVALYRPFSKLDKCHRRDTVQYQTRRRAQLK